MAKTIMISNDIYKELKKAKGENSFTNIIKVFLEKSKKEKLGKNLFPFFGSLEKDKEYEKIIKDIRKGWSSWSKKYA